MLPMDLSRICLTLWLFMGVSVQYSYSQSVFKSATANYKDAIVILQQGDTLRGQIDYRQWQQNPSSFKLKQQGGEQIFTPRDIEAFMVEGDIYKSQKVDLDVSPTDIRRLNETAVPTVVRDTTLFLLQLVGGEVDLYYFKDAADKDHFFFQEEGGVAKELGYYRYYQDPVRQKHATKEIYKGQLKVLALACQEESLNYDIGYFANDLVSFFTKYNRCLTGDEQVVRNNSTSKGKLGIVVTGGVQFTHYKFFEDLRHFDGVTTLRLSHNNVAPVFGVGVNYVFPRGRGQYALVSDILYSHQNIETAYTVGKSQQFRDAYQLNALQLMLALRYSASLSDALATYFSVGGSFINFFHPELHKEWNQVNSVGMWPSDGKYSSEFQPWTAGVILGVGSTWKRFGFELRLHKELAMWHAADGSSNATHVLGLFSYSIFNTKL